MRNSEVSEIVISGIGISSAIGQGKKSFWNALVNADHNIGFLNRPGRNAGSAFLGSEIPDFDLPGSISKRNIRSSSLTGKVALLTLDEAYHDAKLSEADPNRVGLVIGGSNLQQREQVLLFEKYKDRPEFVSSNHALHFMDSDLCGLCTEEFPISGMSYTVGGASASGQLAILQAVQAVKSAQVDICIAMGALMDLSHFELQAFRSLGAMGSDNFKDAPDEACRPFDISRDGFIFGENCGAVVIESLESAIARNAEPLVRFAGGAMFMDGNRGPNPSLEGEHTVIEETLRLAGFSPKEISYINTHGTGSNVGDEIELEAIKKAGLSHAYLNATKSITGHGLTAAGAVEVIATLLQMKESMIHPTRNLENPIEILSWVKDKPISHNIRRSMSLSFGFGGINTAICLEKY